MTTSGVPPKSCIEIAVGDFLFHCKYEKNLDEKTISAYKIDLEQFCKQVQSVVLNDINHIPKDVIKNYMQVIAHYKPNTIKRKVASLKAMFNYLEYEDDNFNNPFHKIKIKLKMDKTLPAVMTINEVRKILTFLYKELEEYEKQDQYGYSALIRNIAIVELLFATGIRVSELCGLKKENIDIRSGFIKVFGKGSKERIIQICDSESKAILKRYYQLNKTTIKSGEYFFVNRLKKPLSTQSVRLMLHRYIQQLGLTKHITPHTFRHTFATLLLEENVDIRYIQGMLGHSTITTTQIYTHLNSEKQKRILATKHPRRKLSFQ